MEKRIARPWVGILFLGVIALHDANASPEVPISAKERQCANLSRYALVARSLAEARVNKQTARSVLGKMYSTDERGQQLASLVLDYAYRDKTYAAVFATQFEAACLGRGGKARPFEAFNGGKPRPRRILVM